MDNIQAQIDLFLSKNKRNEESYLLLARLAAVPLLLSPDLLYKLWRNFKSFTNSEGKTISIPYLVVSDLLLSNFCRPVGYQLYKIEEDVRLQLLKALEKQQKLQVATFLEQYAIKSFSPSEKNIQNIHLKLAKSYLRQEEFINEIKEDLLNSKRNSLEKSHTLNLYYQLEAQSDDTNGLGLTLRPAQDEVEDVLEIERRFLRGKIEKVVGEKDIVSNEIYYKDEKNEYLTIKENLDLKKISFDNCDIVAIEISGNIKLEEIIINNSDIKSLYLKSNSKLTTVKITNSNIPYFQSANVSAKYNIEIINSNFDKFDVNNLEKLEAIGSNFEDFNIQSLIEFIIINSNFRNSNIVKKNTLKKITINDTQQIDVAFVQVFKNLEYLNLKNNKIAKFDNNILDELPKLKELYLQGNELGEFYDKHDNCLPVLKALIVEDYWLNEAYNREIEKIIRLSEKLDIVVKATNDILKIIAPDLRESGYYIQNAEGKITHLNLLGFELKDISFLSDFYDLEVLNLHTNRLADLSVLKHLIKLKHPNLNYNQIEDISPISNLINITDLCLNYNQIVDIRAIANLINIIELGLGGNQIIDLSPIGKLTNIIRLGLGSNKIEDIRPLYYLRNLEELDLCNNQIKNIDNNFLSFFPKCTHLYLKGNPITNIPKYIFDIEYNCLPALKEWVAKNENTKPQQILALEGLLNLEFGNQRLKSNYYLQNQQGKITHLVIKDTHLSEIAALSDFSDLEYLDIRFNQISMFNCEDLDIFPKLKELYLRGNPIKNIPENIFEIKGNCFLRLKKFLKKTNQILYLEKQLNFKLKKTEDFDKIFRENLRESGFYISDFEDNVTHLNLLGFELRDLSILSNFEELAFLNLSANRISNIEPLSNLIYLDSLDLSNNRIDNVLPLSNLNNLNCLFLDNNEIDDISKLPFLENLEELYIQSNKILHIDESIFQKFPKLNALYLQGNSIENIPVEIIGSGNCLDRLRAFFNKKKEKTSLYEYLIILIENKDVFAIIEKLDTIFDKNKEFIEIKKSYEQTYKAKNLLYVLEDLDEFIEKNKEKLSEYHPFFVEENPLRIVNGFQIKLKNIDFIFDLELELTDTHVREMGDENHYYGFLIIEDIEVEFNFFEYPLNKANSVSISGKNKDLVENSEIDLLNQFQRWLSPEEESASPLDFSSVYWALDFLIENPMESNKESLKYVLIQSYEFLEELMRNGLSNHVYSKYATKNTIEEAAVYSISIIEVESKSILIKGKGSIHISIDETDENMNTIPSDFDDFIFTIKIEKLEKDTWKVIEESYTLTFDENDDDTLYPLTFASPQEALVYFVKSPNTTSKDEIIEAIKDDNYFFFSILSQLLYGGLDGKIAVGNYEIDEVFVKDITHLEYDLSNDEIAISGSGHTYVLIDYYGINKTNDSYPFTFDVRIEQDTNKQWIIADNEQNIVNVTKQEDENAPNNEPPYVNEEIRLDKASIKQLIAQYRIKEAIDALSKALPTQEQNNILMLQGRWNSLERGNNLNILTTKNFNVERSKIIKALLSLSESLVDETKINTIDDLITLVEVNENEAFYLLGKMFENINTDYNTIKHIFFNTKNKKNKKNILQNFIKDNSQRIQFYFDKTNFL